MDLEEMRRMFPLNPQQGADTSAGHEQTALDLGTPITEGNIDAPDGIGPSVPIKDDELGAYRLVPAVDETGAAVSEARAKSTYEKTGQSYGLFETQESAEEYQRTHTGLTGREAIRSALLLSKGISPEQIAKDKETAKRLGLPTEFVTYGRDDAENEDVARQISKFKGLVDYASKSPYHAAVVKGDLSQLVQVAQWEQARKEQEDEARRATEKAIREAGADGEVRAMDELTPAEAFERGRLEDERAQLGLAFARGEDITEREAALAEKLAPLEKKLTVASGTNPFTPDDRPLSFNDIVEQSYTTARIMQKGALTAGYTALGVMGAGAATGAAAGSVVPGAGTAAGAGAGALAAAPAAMAGAGAAFTSESTVETFKAELGSQIMSLREMKDADGNPLPRDVIVKAAIPYALAAAGIETISDTLFLKALKPLGITLDAGGAGTRQMVKAEVQEALKQSAATAVKDKNLLSSLRSMDISFSQAAGKAFTDLINNPGLKEMAGRTAFTATQEGTTESVQEALSIAGEEGAKAIANGEGMNFEHEGLTPERMKRITDAGIAGAAGALLFGGAPIFTNGIVSMHRAKAAQNFAQTHADLHALVENLQTKSIDPGETGRMLEEMVPDTREQVSIPMAEAYQLYQEGTDILTPLGISPETAQKDALLGNSVQVKLSDLHARLDQPQFEAAATVMERDGSLSAREAQEAPESLLQKIRQQLDAGTEEQARADGTSFLTLEQRDSFSAAQKALRDEVLQAVKQNPNLMAQNGGRVSKAEAYVDRLMQLNSRVALSIARRSGQDPSQLLRRIFMRGFEPAEQTEAQAEKQIASELSAMPEKVEPTPAPKPAAKASTSSVPVQPVSQVVQEAPAQAPAAEPPALGTTKGLATKVVFPNGTQEAMHYEVWPLSQAIASNDPLHNFQSVPEHRVQDRDYTSASNSQLRADVLRHAAELDPEIVLSNSVQGTDGPPVATAEGIVLGGNSRTMSIKYAQAMHPGRYAAYRQALIDRAASFGIDPGAVASMDSPILVRVVDRPMNEAEMKKASIDYNREATHGKTIQEQGVSGAKNVSEQALNAFTEGIGEDQSIDQFLNSDKSADFITLLLKDNAIPPEKKNEFVKPGGTVTDQGRTLVKSILRGMVIDDHRVLTNAPEDVLEKLDRCLPTLAELKAKKGGDWHRIVPAVKDAVALIVDMGNANISRADMPTQAHNAGLTGEEPAQGRKSVQALAAMLAKEADDTASQQDAQKEVEARFRLFKMYADRDVRAGSGKEAVSSLTGEKPISPAGAFVRSFMRPVAMLNNEPVMNFHPSDTTNRRTGAVTKAKPMHRAIQIAAENADKTHTVASAVKALDKMIKGEKDAGTKVDLVDARKRLEGESGKVYVWQPAAVIPYSSKTDTMWQGAGPVNSFGIPMEHVTTLGNVSWEEVKAALQSLRGQDLHNYLENEDAQVNSTQSKKILSGAAIRKSKLNGFPASTHNAAVSAVKKLWSWSCKTGVKGSKANPEKVDRYVSSLQTADGVDAFAWFTVKETQEGLRIYSVELMDQEKLRGNFKANSAEALRPAHLSFDQVISKLRGESNGPENIILEQASGLANGSITKREDATYVIDLFQRANLSTLPHELGHVYFLELERLHREGLMDADLQDDYKKLCDFVGAKVGDTLTTEQHEKLARAWESYLMEGKSPAPEMRGTFARFRDWMIRIYQSLKNLNVELSDEVRGVFDRMIATREEIEETAAEHEVINLTSDQMDAMGMPRSQQEYNRAVLAEAKKMAAERLQERRDSDRLARRARFEREAREEVSARPAYQAKRDMQKEPIDFIPLKNAVGDWLAEKFYRAIPGGVSKRKAGADPEAFAAAHGYASAAAMCHDILNSKGFRKAVKELADEKEQTFDAQFDAAEDLIHTPELEDHASLLGRELSRQAGEAYIQQNAIKRVAEDEMQKTPTQKAMQYKRMMADMRRALRAMHKAIDAGDYKAALEANTRARVQLEMARRASDLKDEVNKVERRLTRFLKSKSAKGVAKYFAARLAVQHGFMDKLPSHLEDAYSDENISEWQDELKEGGSEFALDPEVLKSTQHWGQMPAAQMDAFVDCLDQIMTIERNQRKLLTAQGQISLEQAVEEMEQSARKNGQLKKQTTIEKENKALSYVKGLHAFHMKVEEMCLEMDGGEFGGAFWKYIYRPISRADDVQAVRMRKVRDDCRKLFSVYSTKELALMGTKKEFVPSIGESLTYENRLAIALNMGNAVNRERVLSGHKWDDRQLKDVLAPLTARDWNFVQSVWDYFETFKAESFKLEEDITGSKPVAVEAQPFTVQTSDGQTLPIRGGYYPIKYNRDKSFKQFARDQKEMDKELFGGRNYGQAMTKHGHLKDRTKYGLGEPLLMELSVIPDHLYNTVHDLAYRRAVLDVAKVLRSDRVRAAIEGYYGKEIYRELMPWLQDVSNEMQQPFGQIQRWAHWARSAGSTMQMGFKATTIFSQISGLTQTMDVLGTRYTCEGLKLVYSHPFGLIDLYKKTCEVSPFMATRLQSFDRDVRDMTKVLQTSRIRGWVQKVQEKAFTPIGILQMGVDLPTWWGAYAKGMDLYKDAGKAAEYADSIVRQSQSSGSTKDLAHVQRGGDFARLWTMFYSYFNTLYNLGARHIKELRKDHSAAGIFRAANSAILLWFLPAAISELLAGRWGGDDDESTAGWLARLWLAYPFQTVVGVRDVVNAISSGYGYQLSPAQAAPESIVKFFKTISPIVDGDEDVDTEKAVKATAEAAGYVFSLPLKQPIITLGNLWDYMTDPKSEFYVRDLFFVKPKDRQK